VSVPEKKAKGKIKKVEGKSEDMSYGVIYKIRIQALRALPFLLPFTFLIFPSPTHGCAQSG
jgi:hypothetical protein